MNELITRERAAMVTQLSQRATLIDIRKDAETYPRIKSYEYGALMQEMKGMVMMVYQYRGQRPDNAQEIEVMASSLCAELLADEFGDETKELTVEEIRRALRKAALGRGAEMYGINVRSLYDAIADYRHTDVEQACRDIRQARDNEQREGYMTCERVVEKYAQAMAQAARERGEALP